MEEFSYEDHSASLPDEDGEGAFLSGFMDDEEVIECAECGSAVGEKPVKRTFEGEEQIFCSRDCLEDFKDGLE